MKNALEGMLDEELSEQLGYQKHSPKRKNTCKSTFEVIEAELDEHCHHLQVCGRDQKIDLFH
ncbi:MAG: hypothetical protein AB2L26_04200 [Ignavibacteria bacterium]